MTNQQFQIVLEMIIKIIEESKDTKEAVEKIKAFLKQKSERGGGQPPKPSPHLLYSCHIIRRVNTMTPQEKYDKENTQFIGLKLNKKNDSDILNAIDGKAKQTELKRLIRLGLSAEDNMGDIPTEGMTDYQLKVFLSLLKSRAEDLTKEDFILEIDKMINNL